MSYAERIITAQLEKCTASLYLCGIEHQHFILFKPWNYVSQFISNEKRRKNKNFLGTLYDFPEGTMAIGRLDEKSEGLLLLTTDGKMSAHVRSSKVEKEYYAEVEGIITDEAINQLRNGVEIRPQKTTYHTKPCKVHRLPTDPEIPKSGNKERHEGHGPTSWISVTLTEGKFRQVRKMTAAVGFPTFRLVRVRIGNIHLGNMQPGEVTPVSMFGL